MACARRGALWVAMVMAAGCDRSATGGWGDSGGMDPGGRREAWGWDASLEADFFFVEEDLRDAEGDFEAEEKGEATEAREEGGSVASECAPPAGIGCPCEANVDCLGGFCVLTDEGRRCTATCDGEDVSCLLTARDWCRVPGWALQKVISPLYGALWYCLPLHPKLCRPCRTDEDCASWTEAVCLDYGPGGRFCGTRCNDVVACPEGYVCEDVAGAPGLDRACRLAEGECGCSALAVLEGASTVCWEGEGSGACLGERRCEGGGLSACSAAAAAPEVCDQADNDCDGDVDEEGAQGCTFYFRDADGDGFGADPGRCLCAPAGGYAAVNNADCDDAEPAVHPGAADVCDGRDNDCDGQTDEDGGGDLEACNGHDDDCDGQVDEEGAQGCVVFYQDADGDGFGVAQDSKCLCAPVGAYRAQKPGDCHDTNGAIHPGAAEACNGLDDDCDGQTDPAGTCPVTPTRKVCLDAGHGGSDPGAVGYVVEKDVNLDIVLRFRDLLGQDTANQGGGGSWQVFLTRDKDVDVSLEARVAYANNNNVDRFLSTHNNACGYCGGNGTETYWYTQGSAQSQDLAGKVQNQVVAHLGTKNRGVKQANFYVIKYTNMPAILLEGAFVDHEGDAAKLANPAMRQEIARGQLHGLQQHYGYGEYDP